MALHHRKSTFTLAVKRMEKRGELAVADEKGRRKGEYAIAVTANFRLTFTFEAGDVLELNLEDYH